MPAYRNVAFSLGELASFRQSRFLGLTLVGGTAKEFRNDVAGGISQFISKGQEPLEFR